MKTCKNKQFLGYILSMTSALSLWVTPAMGNYPNVADSECCEYEENKCCNSWWTNVALIAGAAAVGGLVGAAVADGKHGHRGHQGEPGATGATGATGPAGATGPTGTAGPGFIADTGESLTFNTTGLFPSTPAGSLTIIPFVTGPDGTTIEGQVVISPIGGGTINFFPITVQNPIFGSYTIGLSTVNTDGVLAGVALNGTIVSASRDASQTVQLVPLAGVTIFPGQNQFSVTYIYDPDNIP